MATSSRWWELSSTLHPHPSAQATPAVSTGPRDRVGGGLTFLRLLPRRLHRGHPPRATPAPVLAPLEVARGLAPTQPAKAPG